MKIHNKVPMSNGSLGELPWYPILLSTVVAGSAVGLLFHFQLYILSFFGLLIGIPSKMGGVILHGTSSVIFATVFASLLTQTRVKKWVTGSVRVIVAGVAYGVFLFLGVFGLVLPFLTIIRPVRALPVPYLPVDVLFIHLVFGLLLGLTFAVTWSPGPEIEG
jgi:hypothetical protein